MSPAGIEPAIPASEGFCPRGEWDLPVNHQRRCENKASRLLSRDFAKGKGKCGSGLISTASQTQRAECISV
jgi:hypothetical protein